VYPDRQPQRIVDRYPDSQAAARANGVYARLARLNLTTLGAEHFSPEERAFLRFDGGGQRVFDAWLAGLMTRLDADEEHPVVVSHLSKHRSLMPSLALLLHLMEAVDQPPELLPGRRGAVSHAAAQRAVAWCEYLEAHARRLYASVTDGAALAAKLLSTKLRRGDLKNPFRAREIFKKGWAGLTEKESVYPALGLLEELGWVRPEVERGEKGGRPTILYWINPKLLVGESPS
jgi:hypothetical protein